eukprot:COSAG02_NODE_3641_length_6437_cov_237.157936_6_plen_69_part_00
MDCPVWLLRRVYTVLCDCCLPSSAVASSVACIAAERGAGTRLGVPAMTQPRTHAATERGARAIDANTQ